LASIFIFDFVMPVNRSFEALLNPYTDAQDSSVSDDCQIHFAVISHNETNETI